MTEVSQKILSKTANKNSPPVSAKQKAQNTQPGGPTIGGVAGVGKQKTATRPKSSQSTKTPSPHGVRTGPLGEDAPAMSAGGAGDPGQVQNATSNYAFQVKKKVRAGVARRKKPQ